MTLKSWLEVTQDHSDWYRTIRKFGCGFLFAFRSNYGSILHQFRDKARYWSKIVIFHTPLHSTPPLGGSNCCRQSTELNSTRGRVEFSWVELRRYRHPHRRNSTVAGDRQRNWPSCSVQPISAKQVSRVELSCVAINGPLGLSSRAKAFKHTATTCRDTGTQYVRQSDRIGSELNFDCFR